MSSAEEAEKLKKWVLKTFPKETLSDNSGMFLEFPLQLDGSVQYSRDKQIGHSVFLFLWKLSHIVLRGKKINLNSG